MPKAPSKKLTAQKDNQPTPVVNARRRGHGAAKHQENTTGGAPDDSSSAVGLKTVSRRSSRLQRLPTDAAATATSTSTCSTHPAPTVVSSQAPKRKRGSGMSKKKNLPPIPPPENPPTHRTIPVAPTISTRLSPLTDKDEGDTGQTLPSSKESAQPSGSTTVIGQGAQTDGEDTDEVPPPPKRRKVATDQTRSRGSSVVVSQAGSSNSTNVAQPRPAMLVRSDPNKQNESTRIRELMKELDQERG